MSAFQVQLRQAIPPWGWSRLREAVAESRTQTSQHALREAEVQLRREVFVLFWRLTLSRMLEAVTRDHIARTEEMLRAVRSRYETGSAGQHEVLRLQVLRDRLRDDLGDFARADHELRAALARTLSRPADSVFATPERLEPRPVVGEVSDWLALAREERSELKRIAESVRTSEAGAKLARLEGIPEVTLWLAYRVRRIDTPLDDGTDQVSAGVSIPIPWGSGQRSRAQQAARLQAARGGHARLTAELDRIESELASVHARWGRAFEQAVAYRDRLTPDARAALDASFANYTVGRADFATLFEAEVDLLGLERTLRSASVETLIQEAVASAIIGAAPQGGQP
jgi:outer membrane protein TolC